MKLLTLNCHSWLEENQLEKLKCLAETIKEKSYDVIALQEVSQLIENDVDSSVKEDNYAYLLIKELQALGVTDYDFVWDFSHYAYDKYEEGLAILTKHKINKKYSFFVTQSDNVQSFKTRKIVGVKIQINKEDMSFYSCHLGWWSDEEEPFTKQVDSLGQFVQKDKKYFLMGDFNNNASIRGEGYDYLLSKGLYDTYLLAQEKDIGTTVEGKIAGWDENKQDLRIDYIFSNSMVPVKKSKVIFNGTNKPIISDHYGVEIELTL